MWCIYWFICGVYIAVHVVYMLCGLLEVPRGHEMSKDYIGVYVVYILVYMLLQSCNLRVYFYICTVRTEAHGRATSTQHIVVVFCSRIYNIYYIYNIYNSIQYSIKTPSFGAVYCDLKKGCVVSERSACAEVQSDHHGWCRRCGRR
jgi:hypothetical protein